MGDQRKRKREADERARDHLYFDRVHIFAPVIHRRRYFARAKNTSYSIEPFPCLQHAMWTLAASFSSQFRHIRDALYAHTKGMLEALEMDTPNGDIAVEQAQAWTLLAIYEFMGVNYRRGWMSAGRCFRLVQLMKLHEIDGPGGLPPLSWVEIEERRRTFWMAYALDRFINLLNRLPLTLNEQVVRTPSCPSIEPRD
jgi:hypothetical protein